MATINKKKKNKDIVGQINGEVSGTNNIAGEGAAGGGLYEELVKPTDAGAAPANETPTDALPPLAGHRQIKGGNGQIINVLDKPTSERSVTTEDVKVLNQDQIDAANAYNQQIRAANQKAMIDYGELVKQPVTKDAFFETRTSPNNWMQSGDRTFSSTTDGGMITKLGPMKPIMQADVKIPDAIKSTTKTTEKTGEGVQYIASNPKGSSGTTGRTSYDDTVWAPVVGSDGKITYEMKSIKQLKSNDVNPGELDINNAANAIGFARQITSNLWDSTADKNSPNYNPNAIFKFNESGADFEGSMQTAVDKRFKNDIAMNPTAWGLAPSDISWNAQTKQLTIKPAGMEKLSKTMTDNYTVYNERIAKPMLAKFGLKQNKIEKNSPLGKTIQRYWDKNSNDQTSYASFLYGDTGLPYYMAHTQYNRLFQSPGAASGGNFIMNY